MSGLIEAARAAARRFSFGVRQLGRAPSPRRLRNWLIPPSASRGGGNSLPGGSRFAIVRVPVLVPVPVPSTARRPHCPAARYSGEGTSRPLAASVWWSSPVPATLDSTVFGAPIAPIHTWPRRVFMLTAAVGALLFGSATALAQCCGSGCGGGGCSPGCGSPGFGSFGFGSPAPNCCCPSGGYGFGCSAGCGCPRAPFGLSLFGGGRCCPPCGSCCGSPCGGGCGSCGGCGPVCGRCCSPPCGAPCGMPCGGSCGGPCGGARFAAVLSVAVHSVAVHAAGRRVVWLVVRRTVRLAAHLVARRVDQPVAARAAAAAGQAVSERPPPVETAAAPLSRPIPPSRPVRSTDPAIRRRGRLAIQFQASPRPPFPNGNRPPTTRARASSAGRRKPRTRPLRLT